MQQLFTVLVFGPLADAAGAPAVQVHFPADRLSCAELRKALQEQHPSLTPLLRSCRLAVNHAFVPDSRLITPGEELALIGFVSGG
jgi:molybdopterin converting factor small subunit